MPLKLDPPSLDRLLEACRRGDSEAWGRLIDSTRDLVWTAAKRQGMNDDDASDAFQSAYVALHGALESLRSGAALPKWLAVTTARECHRIRRRNARVSPVEESVIEAVPDDEVRADEQAQSAADAFMVRGALADLGGKCRELLSRLYFDAEADYAAISTEMGMPVGSIGPTRARCLEKLRKVLEKTGFFGAYVSGLDAGGSE